MAILIACCPEDAPTAYGYYYWRRFADFAAKRGFKVVFVKSANLPSFRKALLKYDPRLVILDGHGGSKGVTGCNNNVILGVVDYDPELGKKIEQQNPNWMAGRIVYLATCHAGKELARRLLTYGALAVAAYKDSFIFLSQDSVNPPVDKRAYPYFEALLQLPLHLVNGNTFEEGCLAVKEIFTAHRDMAELKGDELAAKYFHFDLVNFVYFGTRSVRL